MINIHCVLLVKMMYVLALVASCSGTPTLGGRRANCPLCPLPWKVQEGQNLPLMPNSFHLSCLVKGVFCGVVDNLALENFSGGKPPDSNLRWCYYETHILNNVLLGKRFKTKIYPYRGTYIYIDVPSEEALLPYLRFVQASLF